MLRVVVSACLLAVVLGNGRGYNFENDNCVNRMKANRESFDGKLEKKDCKGAVRILERNVLNRCRPSDPVRILAHLRVMLSDLEDACPDIHRNIPYATCLNELFFEEDVDTSLAGIRCGDELVNYHSARKCLEDYATNSGCKTCGFLRHVISAEREQLCSDDLCINSNGIYHTVSGTNCTEFTREELFTGTVRSHDTSLFPGHIFDLDYCGWDSADRGACYN